MSEILSAVRLKDRIIIISSMVLFAVLLAVSVGAVTEATVDVHKHSFEYHMERGDDGDFDFVGICTDEACEDPRFVQDIISGVTDKVTAEPTCCQAGNTQYTLIYGGKIYTLNEEIPKLPHEYSGSVVTDGGTSSIHAFCTNEGCTSPELKVEETTDIKLEEFTEATCHTPRYEKYTYTINGETVTIESYIDEDVPHTLNGVFVTELEVSDGIFPYGTEGVKLVGFDYLSCGQKGSGNYTCEVCSELKQAYVVRADHTFEYMDSETVLPTDKNTGNAIIKCTAEDCGETRSVLLPSVVVDENSVVVSRDQDKENQTVTYIYTSNEYGFTVEAEIIIPWVNHLFEYSEADVVHPTFDADGSVTLRCKNSICSEERVITLPKMAEAYNTTVVYYHILEKKTVIYLYENVEYGFEITFSYDESWIDHSYAYSESETVNPDFENDGIAYVRCSYEGCEKYHEIVIPKIVVGVNAQEVAPATEQAASLVRYTYQNDEYGFTVTFDFNIGEPLSHDYKYSLEKSNNVGFDFVGKCNQPGCQEPELREENVEVVDELVESTCTTDGYLRVTYERDGVVYELVMSFGFATGHKYVASSVTNPTFSKEGIAVLHCENEGCQEVATITLPKIEFGVTAFEVPDAVDGQLYYMYYDEEYGFEHFFLV